MAVTFANFAQSRLVADITNSATSFDVQDGSIFPSSGTFYVVIDNEIIKVTARSSNTFTVERGQESTSGAPHTLGSLVTNCITTGSLATFINENTGSPGAYEYAPMNNGFRLTLDSGSALPATDQTAKTNLYLVPAFYRGVSSGPADIALNTGGNWSKRSASSVTIDNTGLSADTNYDVFAKWDGLEIDLSLSAWTNNTTRAITLIVVGGVLVDNADNERRYLGTVRTDGSGNFEDSEHNRFVWNLYNQQRRGMCYFVNVASWSISSTTWRQWYAAATSKVSCVVGLPTSAFLSLLAHTDGDNVSYIAMGLGSTTPIGNIGASVVGAGKAVPITVPNCVQFAAGLNEVYLLERVNAGTQTHYGVSGGDLKSGMAGSLFG